MRPINARGVLAAASAVLLACWGIGVSEPQAVQAGDGNAWQIVDGRYDASHSTSRGIGQAQLGDYGFVESPDGSVRVTKTVEPTDTEDEFIVHLSVDTCAVSAQQTDYKSYFETAPYQGVVSNNYHAADLGEVKSSVNGSAINVTADLTKLPPNTTASDFKKSAYITVLDPQGRPIAENVKVYWDKGNNITFFLKIDESTYIMMGLSMNTGSTADQNRVRLSEEAYRIINDAIAGKVKQGPKPTLNLVTDVMGDRIEYLGSAQADAGSVAFDGTSTLTWTPQYSPSCAVVAEDPVFDYERNSYGAVTKLTITRRTWYYGAASLSYRVRLRTGAGLASSYDPAVGVNPYLTNNGATLDYTYSAYDKADNQFHEHANATVDFPRPQVKGVTYDLRTLKWNVDDDAPLAGATFRLTRAWTDSFGVAHEDVVSDSLVSGDNGYVVATGLPWGTYKLEEIATPAGFVLPQGAVRTFDLCRTKDASVLTASTISPVAANRAMSATEQERVDNERVKTDVTLHKVDANDTSKPLGNAGFKLFRDDGDGVFDPKADELRLEGTTDEGGNITFGQLTVGTYFLQESKAPSGYQLNDNVYRIRVFDVAGQAGGADGNMIQVGNVSGDVMRAPDAPNTVTVADKPIPTMPVTAGPGVGNHVRMGLCLVGAGCLACLASSLRTRRRHASECLAAH